MRLSYILLALLLLAPAAHAQSVRHRGYVKKTGTYVAPHRQMRPDKSRANNWSSKGRVNPYTGKKGTVNPYKPRVRPRAIRRIKSYKPRSSYRPRKRRD